eukprot:8971383-Pyramimonas_sp.AAC.1
MAKTVISLSLCAPGLRAAESGDGRVAKMTTKANGSSAVARSVMVGVARADTRALVQVARSARALLARESHGLHLEENARGGNRLRARGGQASPKARARNVSPATKITGWLAKISQQNPRSAGPRLGRARHPPLALTSQYCAWR